MGSSFKMNDEIKEELIVESYKQARTEISLRIQTNINLILQKIVTCGAALGFLMSQKNDPNALSLVSSDVQLLGFILIPIIAMLYDVLIARNIKGMNLLANFIRTEIEILVPEVTLWETYLSQKYYIGRKISIEGTFLNLFTLGTEIVAVFVYFGQKRAYLLFIVVLLVLHYFTFRLVQNLRFNSPNASSEQTS